MAINQTIQDELTKLFPVLDRALVTALGSSATFNESPAAGEIVAITNPTRWNRLNDDLVQISGTIWIVAGASTFPEARARLIDLSSRISHVEMELRKAIQDLAQIRPYLSPDINLAKSRTGQYPAWDLEITAREDNAHQEAPWTGQIRPGFELDVAIRML
jgi:hypothetical protein